MINMVSADAVQELLDREAIRTVLGRYCRAVDRGDAELMRTVYWPDATEWHGSFVGLSMDFVDLAVLAEGYESLWHSLGTINIDLQGSTAYSEAYFSSRCVPIGRSNGARSLRLHEGRYIDRFEKREGEWRVADRKIVSEFTDQRVLNETGEVFLASKRGAEDLSYLRD